MKRCCCCCERRGWWSGFGASDPFCWDSNRTDCGHSIVASKEGGVVDHVSEWWFAGEVDGGDRRWVVSLSRECTLEREREGN